MITNLETVTTEVKRWLENNKEATCLVARVEADKGVTMEIPFEKWPDFQKEWGFISVIGCGSIDNYGEPRFAAERLANKWLAAEIEKERISKLRFKYWRSQSRGSYGWNDIVGDEIFTHEQALSVSQRDLFHVACRELRTLKVGERLNLRSCHTAGDDWGFMRVE